MRNFGLNLKKNYLLLISESKNSGLEETLPPQKKGLDSRPLIHAIS